MQVILQRVKSTFRSKSVIISDSTQAPLLLRKKICRRDSPTEVEEAEEVEEEVEEANTEMAQEKRLNQEMHLREVEREATARSILPPKTSLLLDNQINLKNFIHIYIPEETCSWCLLVFVVWKIFG